MALQGVPWYIGYHDVPFCTGDKTPVAVIGLAGPGSSATPVMMSGGATANPMMMSGGTAMSGAANSSGPSLPSVKQCSVCKINRANPGRSWCERCYTMARAQKH